MKYLILKYKNFHLNFRNILIDDKENIKIADFGFSRILDSTFSSLTHGGTNGYMSPEMFFKNDYSYNTDIW